MIDIPYIQQNEEVLLQQDNVGSDIAQAFLAYLAKANPTTP